MKHKLTGVGPALVTPFHKDLSIDFDGLKKLLQHVSPHVDYLVVQGTTGESATTSLAEKQEILDFVKANNERNLPIVMGVGGNHTLQIVETLKKLDLSGVEAILSVSPYYNKPSQTGIIAHYQTIADNSPVPVILYNVPGRTSSNIAAETTLKLAKHSNILGIKEASGDLEQCMRIASEKPDDFLLISGEDMLTSAMISLGAVGVISVLANAFPKTFSDGVHAALEQDFPKASSLLFEFLDINPLMYKESNPVGVKAALALKGVCGDAVRLPLVPPTEALKNVLDPLAKKVS